MSALRALLTEQQGSSASASSGMKSHLESHRRRLESDEDDRGVRPKKRNRIIVLEEISDSETELDSQAELDPQVETDVLVKIRYRLEQQFSYVLPSYDEFMTAFDIGYEKKDLCLTIKLTFLKIMDLEGQWRTYDEEYSIGFIKFSVLKALWRTLLNSAGNSRDVDDLLNMLKNCLKSLVQTSENRLSLRQEHGL